jgi:hypothetical protein
VEKKNVFET